MPRFNRRGYGVHARNLTAARVHRDAEHLLLQYVDDRAAVRLVLDQCSTSAGVQHPHRPDRLNRGEEVQVLVHHVPAVVVVPPLAPDRDRHEVVAVLVLERGVYGYDLRAELRQRVLTVVLPPVALEQITLLHTRGALVQGGPRTSPAVRVTYVGVLEVPQPRLVLAKLRAERLSGGAPQRVVLLRLYGEPQQCGVVLAAKNTRGEIVLVPRGHNEHDLRPGGETGLQRVLPLIPDTRSGGWAVRLYAVLDRVVYEKQVRRVARDAGHNAAAYHAPLMIVQLKLGGAVDLPDAYAEKRAAIVENLFLVPAAESLRRFLVVACLDDAIGRVLAEIPARESLGQRHGFTVLRRALHDEDVVCIPRLCLDELLHGIGQKTGEPCVLPSRCGQREIVGIASSRQLARGEFGL